MYKMLQEKQRKTEDEKSHREHSISVKSWPKFIGQHLRGKKKMFMEEKRDMLEYNMLKKMKFIQRRNV